jgi:hypothetical protein
LPAESDARQLRAQGRRTWKKASRPRYRRWTHTVRGEAGDDAQGRYAAAVQAQLGWQPVPGEFALFAMDINDVTFIGHDAGSNAQHVARWPAGEEYLCPSLMPTTLGPPDPVRRLLSPGR